MATRKAECVSPLAEWQLSCSSAAFPYQLLCLVRGLEHPDTIGLKEDHVQDHNQVLVSICILLVPPLKSPLSLPCVIGSFCEGLSEADIRHSNQDAHIPCQSAWFDFWTLGGSSSWVPATCVD